jgi:hypothetical protein
MAALGGRRRCHGIRRGGVRELEVELIVSRGVVIGDELIVVELELKRR